VSSDSTQISLWELYRITKYISPISELKCRAEEAKTAMIFPYQMVHSILYLAANPISTSKDHESRYKYGTGKMDSTLELRCTRELRMNVE
jgi:hypothetical protein